MCQKGCPYSKLLNEKFEPDIYKVSQHRKFLHSVSTVKDLILSGTWCVKKEMLFLMLGASIQASHDQELLNRELLPISVLLVMQLRACCLAFFVVHWICVLIFLYMFIRGTRWHSWLRNCATSWKDTGSIPGGSLWNFSLTLSFLLYYGPGVDSVSNRNEYQEYFLEGKGGQCIWEPHPPGILRACPGLYKDSFTSFTCLF